MFKNIYLKYLIIFLVTIISIHLILSYFEKSLDFTIPWRSNDNNNYSDIVKDQPISYKDVVKSKTTTITKTSMLVETVTLDVEIPQTTIITTTQQPKEQPIMRKAKAVFLVYLGHENTKRMGTTLAQLENRFNHKYQYPYVFLSDKEISDDFKNYISGLTKAKCEYGTIPEEQWGTPSNIDLELFDEKRKELEGKDVLLGGSLTYRYSNRFLSGFFQNHDLLKKYDYYWRVEAGFTISLYEYKETVPTLWNSVKEFMTLNPEYVKDDNWMEFFSNDNGETYNLCHFWTNFEIVDLKLFRSEAYTKFFEFLDEKGGFFYERWSEAPIHSLAAALFLNKNEIHFFNDIGYKQEPFTHCPTEQGLLAKCSCDPYDSFDFHSYSCAPRWLELINKYDIKYPPK
nr:3287_t:CDS:2 [Entrophospora candida]